MEEFIKEHEKEFLDYIDFETDIKKQLEYLNKRKNTMAYEANCISNNEDGRIDFVLEYNVRNDRMKALEQEIIDININEVHLRMSKTIREISDKDLENKDISDFNTDVEILKKEKEKKKLENEIKRLKCEKEKLKQISSDQKEIEKLEQELKDRRSVLNEIIEDRIQLKQRVLGNISRRKEEKEEKEEKLREEIKEKENVISEIRKKVFEDDDLKQLQKDTIERLEEELNEKIEKLNDITIFDEIYAINEEEYSELKDLKTKLYSGNIKELLKPILNIKEEEPDYLYTDPFPYLYEERREDLEEFEQDNSIEVQIGDNNGEGIIFNLENKKSSEEGKLIFSELEENSENDNNEIEQPKDNSENEKQREWVKDENGKFYIVEIEEPKTIKEKISNIWNKVKNIFHNQVLELLKNDRTINLDDKNAELLNKHEQPIQEIDESKKIKDSLKGKLERQKREAQQRKLKKKLGIIPEDNSREAQQRELRKRLGLISENDNQEKRIMPRNVKKPQKIEEDIEK